MEQLHPYTVKITFRDGSRLLCQLAAADVDDAVAQATVGLDRKTISSFHVHPLALGGSHVETRTD